MRLFACHGRRPRLPRGSLLAVILFSAAPVGPAARAATVTELEREMADLERQARSLRIKEEAREVTRTKQAETRLVDAQVLYSLKDYTRAAILLLDYVNKYKDSPGYPEALFFLADALYQKRDFISAKRYFREVVTTTRGKYYQDALQRLVELSLRTGDTSDIQTYLDALSSIPVSQLKPSVPYVTAKYYYFLKQTDRALTYFRAIPRGHKYFFHARYFVGAALVRSKDLSGATKKFQSLLNESPRTTSDKHIRDLCYLALGRIFYEKNKISDAIQMYQKVFRTSPEFDAALYEIAWAYIKQKDFDKALRALELLVLANPDSPFIPEVRVLQGNLLIRQKKWGNASTLFTDTREKYFPIHNRMKQVMTEHSDPNRFFDLLLARSSSFAVKIQVPELAIHWVKEMPGIKRSLNLVSDVREIKESLAEAQQLIEKLERAINSPARIKVFPEFAMAKAQSLEVENRLELARSRILEGERSLVLPLASGGEKDKLHQLATQRTSLEKSIHSLPTSAEGYNDRQRSELNKVQELEQEINRMSIVVDNLRAQLVASEKYAEDTSGKRKPAAMEIFRKEAAQVRQMIEELQQEIDVINQDLGDAKASAGVGGAAEVSERKVKARYRALVKQEHEMLRSLRDRLGSGEQREFDGYSGLMDRCMMLDVFLKKYDDNLESNLEDKLAGIRTILQEEKNAVAGFVGQHTAYTGETDQVAGNLTYDAFRDEAKKFYEIVVRADVGIIDVAWALKDSKTKEVSRLVQQRKMDIKMLDDEFKEVLQEDQ